MLNPMPQGDPTNTNSWNREINDDNLADSVLLNALGQHTFLFENSERSVGERSVIDQSSPLSPSAIDQRQSQDISD